jgi:hypothetical protein
MELDGRYLRKNKCGPQNHSRQGLKQLMGS